MQVRPLLNCLKNTFPLYLELGDEVSLDEASVSSRSRYGSDVIFYNPRKPGGKFHFRFYLMCCSSTYACVRLRVHTKNKSDVADAPPSPQPPRGPNKTKVLFPSHSRIVNMTRAGPKTTGLVDEDKTNDHEACGEFDVKDNFDSTAEVQEVHSDNDNMEEPNSLFIRSEHSISWIHSLTAIKMCLEFGWLFEKVN